MPYFFVKLVAPRETFAMDMSAVETATMEKHSEYWNKHLGWGNVIVFGPVFDPTGTYGIGVIVAPNEAGARAFMAGDPVMKANIGFDCEIYPMNAVTRELVD
jgi:uncharacterized protein